MIQDLIKDRDLSWVKIAEILNKAGSRTIKRKKLWTNVTISTYCHKKYPELAKRNLVCHYVNKPRYYQNIERDEKMCSECKEIKSYSKDFYFQRKYKGKYYPRPECKLCWTRISRNRQNEIKIEKYPDQYWQCEGDECFHVNPNRRKVCFKCKAPCPQRL